MIKELRGASAILLLLIPLLIGSGFVVHSTLMRGATVERLFRAAQYERTQLGLFQVDEETGLRGYLITGDRAFLGPYEAANARWDGVVSALRGNLLALKLGTGDLDKLAAIHDRWVAGVAVPLMRERNPRAAVALEYRGKALVDAFRRVEVAFRLSVQRAAQRADGQLQSTITWTLISSLIASLAVLLGGMVSLALQAQSTRQIFELRVLYENEKRIADALQEAFLPKGLPSAPGVELRGAYIPASLRAQVGGDWYDAFELPDKRIVFSIGDVAGHGLEAAVAMSRARQAILAAALEEPDPASVLQRANAAILLQAGPMVTAICGFIDVAGERIVYATAGHPAPVLARPGSTATFLPQRGYPLGLFGQVEYETFVAEVAAGDLIVFYTDGVVESERDILLGETRLLEAAARAVTADDPALFLYDATIGAGPSPDDVAILTVLLKARDAAGGVPADPSGTRSDRSGSA